MASSRIAPGFFLLANLAAGDLVDLGGTRANRVKGLTDATDELVSRIQTIRHLQPELASKSKGSSKGSKSKGSKSKGSKSKGSKSGSACPEAVFHYKDDDFSNSFNGNGIVGTNGNVPIYDDNGRKVGTYTETTVAVGQFNCITNGVYSFDRNHNGFPDSQIFVSNTCCGTDSQAVIGGTGGFQCSTGFSQQVNKGSHPNKTFRRLVVCESDCFA